MSGPDPLRLSTLFLRTLRDDPAGASAASHRLLVRAGYIRQGAPGAFSWLPLGLMVLGRVSQIVRQEMAAIGCQEVRASLPEQPFEETATLLVADVCRSSKDLPVMLHQIRTRYREEPRPRGGLLRSREYVVAESCSFGLEDSSGYLAHHAAFTRILERVELPHVVVASAGGGEQLLVAHDQGQDSFAECPACHYAANTMAAMAGAARPVSTGQTSPAHVEETPATPTIEALVDHLNADPDLRRSDRRWTAADTLKNVLVMLTHPDGTEVPLAIGLPGDRELDLRRLEARMAPARVAMFAEGDFAAAPRLVKGYIGPGSLGERRGVRYLVDPRVVDGSSWVTGADTADRHVIDLVAGRDFQPDGTIDVAEVRAGDPCPSCGAGLVLRRGIEIARLRRLESRTAGAKMVGPDGGPAALSVGSYRLGLSRAVAAIAESTLDDGGLCWPRSVAPADIHLVAAGKDQAVVAFCHRVAEELAGSGVGVLYDDRAGVSAGVKFKDAELIGVPTSVVVGKGLAEGTVEVRDRRSGRIEVAAASEVASKLIALSVD